MSRLASRRYQSRYTPKCIGVGRTNFPPKAPNRKAFPLSVPRLACEKAGAAYKLITLSPLQFAEIHIQLF